jgi:FKBP-type peptidyl-prolyl cis-trans isomerase
MKKNLIAFTVFATLITCFGCQTNTPCKDVTAQSEQSRIINYAAGQGISATAHSSGLYYQIISSGSGPTPTPASTIFIKYTGKLLDGTVFDTRTTAISSKLNEMIQGFQIGMPLIQKGGTIKLIIPSSLAYGCNGFGSVPGNSILYFEVELTDVQ